MSSDNEKPQWEYNADGEQPVDDLPDQADNEPEKPARASSHKGSVDWEAPEFIAQHHSAAWYFMLFFGAAVLSAGTYFITKDYFATGTMIVLAAIIALAASRQPGTVKYSVDKKSISINQKKYPYSAFKSFSIYHEDKMSSINLFPIKRFMPMLSVHVDSAKEAKVADIIGDSLPYQDRPMDSIDRLSRRLRF